MFEVTCSGAADVAGNSTPPVIVSYEIQVNLDAIAGVVDDLADLAHLRSRTRPPNWRRSPKSSTNAFRGDPCSPAGSVWAGTYRP